MRTPTNIARSSKGLTLTLIGLACFVYLGLVLPRASAQTPQIDPAFSWWRQFGSSQNDGLSAVTADGTGVYVTGWIGGSVLFRKYSFEGNEIWRRGFDLGGGNAVAVDDSGVYLAGYSSIALPGQLSPGGFVRKYDTDGNLIWTRLVGTEFSVARGIAVNSSGLYVTGDIDFGGASFVLKYDFDGNEIWNQVFHSTLAVKSVAIALDTTGVYVGGGVSGALPHQLDDGGVDAFLRKYDLNGNGLWTRQFGSTNNVGATGASGIAVDSGNVYLAGSTGGILPGQFGNGGDGFVRKYDGDGSEIWTRQFGTFFYDEAHGITADTDGIYVVGLSDVYPGVRDTFVRRFDVNGNTVWTRQFGTTGYDSANAVFSNPSGVYVGGSVGGTLTGENSAGGTDAFLARLGSPRPAVNCDNPDGLWHANDVSIVCTASAAFGLANPADVFFALSTSVLNGTETSNAETNSHQVCDQGGNCVTAGPIIGNKVDKKPPGIEIDAPRNEFGVYVINQPVAASYFCFDGGSGLASCAGPIPSGANFDTASVGTKTFTVNAADAVGNATSQIASYRVGYGVCQLYDPTRAVKAGSTMPIKIQLCDVNGNDLSSLGIVVQALSVQQISTLINGLVQDTGNANPDQDFRYEATLGSTGGYIFNLSTAGLTTGTYRLWFSVSGDPVAHMADFQVR